MATKKRKVEGLGYFVVYGLSTDIHIPYDQYFKAAERGNVPLELLPMPLNPIGAFKRATTKIRDMHKADAEPIVVKQIPSTQDNVIMRTFEKRMKSSENDTKRMESGKQYVPVYKPILTIMFDKDTCDMTYRTFTQDSEGQDIFNLVQKEYNKICGKANIQQVRATIQKAFHAYGSIKVRGNGGLDFIPLQHMDEWRVVSNFLDQFDGIDIDEWDMMDSDRNRAKVEKSLLDDIGDSVYDEINKIEKQTEKTKGDKNLNQLIVDFGKVLKKNQSSDEKIGTEALERMLHRYEDTMTKVALYKELLNTDLSVIDSQIAIAKEQLMAIVNKSAA